MGACCARRRRCLACGKAPEPGAGSASRDRDDHSGNRIHPCAPAWGRAGGSSEGVDGVEPGFGDATGPRHGVRRRGISADLAGAGFAASRALDCGVVENGSCVVPFGDGVNTGGALSTAYLGRLQVHRAFVRRTRRDRRATAGRPLPSGATSNIPRASSTRSASRSGQRLMI